MLNKFVYNLLAVSVTVFLFVLTFALCGLAIQSGATGGLLDAMIFVPFALLALTLLWLFGNFDES